MKTVFLYNSPHVLHKAWAEYMDAVFLKDTVEKYTLPLATRFKQSLKTVKQIPEDTDVLICEGGPQIFTGYLWKRKHPDKKAILICSDPKLHYIKHTNAFMRKLYIKFLNVYDLFLPTSPLMKSLIPEEVHGERMIVPPFFEVQKFAAAHADLTSNNIVYTGRLSHEKGADLVQDAFELLQKDFPNGKLFFLGTSSKLPGQGDMRKKLEQRKTTNVTYTGEVEDPRVYMKQCSIYLSLARIDAANIGVLEAMTMGLVPIVSEGVGNAYLVKKIHPDLVVKTPQEAQAMIIKLWRDKELLQSCSESGKKIAKYFTREFSLHVFAEALKKLNTNH